MAEYGGGCYYRVVLIRQKGGALALETGIEATPSALVPHDCAIQPDDDDAVPAQLRAEVAVLHR